MSWGRKKNLCEVSWWWYTSPGEQQTFPTGFICIALLFFCVLFVTAYFFNTWLPCPAHIKVWQIWISMVISIVILYIFVDSPMSFFKNSLSLVGILLHLFTFYCSPGPVYHHLEAWYSRLPMIICTIWSFFPNIRYSKFLYMDLFWYDQTSYIL